VLSSWLGDRVRASALIVGKVIARTGVSPNTLTVLGLLLNVLVALLLAWGYFLPGGLLALVAGSFDMLDGAVARSANKSSIFGGFLDSTLDRYSEAVMLFGLLVFYVRDGSSMSAILLIYATIVGSLMISYARARAEAAGLKNEAGILARPERVILLSFFLILGKPVWALWVLAIGTNLTALQRIYHVYRITNRK